MTQSLNSPVQPLAPLYASGWSDYAGVWQVGGFWKDPLGLVHLRGLLASAGTTAVIAAALPVGFRPKLGEMFAVQHDNSSSVGRVSVGTSGQLSCEVPGAVAIGYLSLSGITFLAGV